METQNLEELQPQEDYGDMGASYPTGYEMDVVPEDVEEES